MTVIPAHLSDGVDNFDYSGQAFDSIRLIFGEVQKIYQTNDPLNISKKVVEYDIWASFYENGTYASRTIRAARASDLFGSGLSDEFTYTLRADSSATISDGSKKIGYGNGSKVLCLAINGSPLNYMIIGGGRNSKAAAMDPADGHHLNFSFNGINASINNDGEFTLEYKGANNNDNSLREDVDENSIGTNISITKDGNLTISDGGGNNLINIDHTSNTITVQAGSEINNKADQVNLGTVASNSAVVGEQLVSILNQLLVAIASISVNVLGAQSSPPVNAAQFVAIQTQLNSILSQSIKLSS